MKDSVYGIIRHFTGQENILTIPRVFIDFTGGHVTALLLSQAIYWTDRTKNPEGWFYKTQKEWEEEIGASRYQLDNGVNKLKSMGILETSLRKANGAPTVHYRVNQEVFSKSICQFLANRIAGNSQIHLQEPSKSLTETTDIEYTESTTDISISSPAGRNGHSDVLDLGFPEPAPAQQQPSSSSRFSSLPPKPKGKAKVQALAKSALPEDTLNELRSSTLVVFSAAPVRYFRQMYARTLNQIPDVPSYGHINKEFSRLIKQHGAWEVERRLSLFFANPDQAQYGYGWRNFVAAFEVYAMGDGRRRKSNAQMTQQERLAPAYEMVDRLTEAGVIKRK